MATEINRLVFKQSYGHYSQGMFIVLKEKRLPKEQEMINVGQALSERLLTIPKAEHKDKLVSVLTSIIGNYKSISLTHLEILFTPYLEVDPIGLLNSLCRNRQLCILWPGTIMNKKAFYAEPGELEYYEKDLAFYQETYIITD